MPVVARTLLEMEHVIVQQNAGTNLVKQREDVQQGKLTNKTWNLNFEYLDINLHQHVRSIMKFSLQCTRKRFGVCCVFVYEASGSTISQNCSYIRNPNYPNAYTDTTSLQYNIVKCDPSIHCFCIWWPDLFYNKNELSF